MAQPSITCYFNTRKRSAIDDLKINRAKKVLLLENNDKSTTISTRTETIIKNQLVNDEEEVKKITIKTPKIIEFATNNVDKTITKRKIVRATKTHETRKNIGNDAKQTNLQEMLTNVDKTNKSTTQDLANIRERLLKNPRLSELKSSIKRFNQTTERLKHAEERTLNITQKQQSPKLKEFKSIEIEVPISPQKTGVSPEKPYLSPRKDTNIARRNLLNSLSPVKEHQLKSGELKLPFKYRYLYELFEGIDTVCQILYNRKETITFRKLKPSVEKMLKRNLTEKQLGQIKRIFPTAYEYTREKLRVFGNCGKREEWELVIKPAVDVDKITEQIILERKRVLYNHLLEKTKEYHNEFLKSLIPPLLIDNEKITRWHPEFDLEQVPEIEPSNDIPQIPDGEKLTGQQVLERAKKLFNCNTRMEQALAKLSQQKQQQETKVEEQQQPEIKQESILKGIPKALLEKVRQKQAAKALLSMTRTTDKQKEIELYQKLPEIARLTRNLFVAEKKSVLLLDIVLEKLANSFTGTCLNNNHQEFEQYLRTISKEINGWISFVTVRNMVYVKLNKDADLSLVLVKLESLAKQKNDET